MSRRHLSLAAAAAIAVALPLAVQAGTSTTQIAVTATIQAQCSITATPMAFGNYSVSTGTNYTSTVGVTCLSSTPYTIDLDAGLHGTLAGGSTTRAMASGTQLLAYNLYIDSTDHNVWATGTGFDVAGTANLSTTTNVYGNIPANQTAGPGSYTDTVNVTVSY